ncbi:MAG: hypothetical protein WCG25_09155 [bacterium]
MLLVTVKSTGVHRIAALGLDNISGLNVDTISSSFSISLILPYLSLTVSFILCFHISSKFTVILLLLSSVFIICTKLGLSKLHS